MNARSGTRPQRAQRRVASTCILVCLATFPVAPLTAQSGEAQGRALAIEDYYGVRSVGSPRL
jgi:hypothetical protein